MAEHSGFWGEAWRKLHRRPKFVVAVALILLVPSVGFMLVIERFLKADVLAKVGH